MSVSLLAAARDRALLGGTLSLYRRQRELLASLDGPESLHVWAIGRQAGKSTLAALAAVHNAALRPDLDARLPAGRTRYVLVGAPSEHQAREFVRLAAAIADASPLLAPLATVTADRIDFTIPRAGGVARTAIRAMPANSRTARGMSASLVICDEFAHFQDTGGPGSDERMLEALTPSTRAFGDAATTLLISTPWGEVGKFYELFRAAEAGLLPSARAVRAPAWEVVPDIGEAWMDARRAEMGEDSFMQESGAEFRSGAGQFFDLRAFELLDGPARPEDGRGWVAGLDPAFHSDRFGCALVGESAQEPGRLLIGRVDALEPVGPARSLEARRDREDRTLARVRELIEPYRPRIVSDQHQAAAIQSYFGRHGLAVRIVNLTGPLQTQAFVALRARLTDGSLSLWRHPQLLEDLRRVRATDSERIELPRYGGGHCDAASALALAAFELRHVGRSSTALIEPVSDPCASWSSERQFEAWARRIGALRPAGIDFAW